MNCDYKGCDRYDETMIGNCQQHSSGLVVETCNLRLANSQYPDPIIEIKVAPDGESFLAGHFLNSVSQIVGYYEQSAGMDEADIVKCLKLYAEILEREI